MDERQPPAEEPAEPAEPAELAQPTADPFPRDRFGALVHHMPAYGKLALRLAKDRQLSKARRAAVVAAAAYLVSPIDAIPGIIPVAGQLDDILLGMAAIRFALAGLKPEERARHLAAAGLTDASIGEDLRHAGAISAWAGRAGWRFGKRGARAAASGARTAVSAAASGARTAGSAAASGTRTAASAAGNGARAVARRSAGAAGAIRDRLRRSPGDDDQSP